ncbi:MAG: hypothetical protein ACFFB0_20110 [Promethearchaeota archaeon]
MRSEYKSILKGIVLCIVSFFIMMWGVSDLVILLDAPRSLIFIIPAIISIIIFCVLVVIFVIVEKRNTLLSEKTIHHCVECGATIRLEEKVCSNCGSDNIKRKEALEKLEEIEKSAENSITKIREKSQSKKWRTPASRKQDEKYLLLYENQLREVKSKKMKILYGSTLEDKKKWVEIQYRQGKSFRKIAEELGEDMITVRHYLDADLEKYKREPDRSEEKRNETKKIIEELDVIVINYFKTNADKAFTSQFILERLEKDIENSEMLEYLQNNIEGVLNRLLFNGKIQSKKHEGKMYYFIRQ